MRAQRGAAALARQGCEVLVVGEAGHPEVEGIVAYAREAGAETHVISSIDDARDFLAKNTVEQAKLKTEGVACVMGSTTGAESSHAPESMGCALPGLASIRAADSTKPADASIDGGCDASAARSDDASDVLHSPSALSAELCCIGVVVQTTQRREAFEAILGTLRAGGLEPIVKDTICSATTERQQAADALSRRVDAMVVIGGRNSSNTTRLAEICASNCPTFHIEMPGELDAVDFSGIEYVGVTAGASTPESQINAVLDYLRQRDGVSGDDKNGVERDPNGGLGRDSGHDHKGDAGRDSKDGADGAK
jgi:(E)-4-hydroxy-3-methyl-but-2-enyl pyrophosphate reductase